MDLTTIALVVLLYLALLTWLNGKKLDAISGQIAELVAEERRQTDTLRRPLHPLVYGDTEPKP